MDFRTKLAKLRTDAGLTQTELAMRLRLSPGAIGNYESGYREPKIEYLQKIADYFNVPVDYLINDKIVSTDDRKFISQETVDLAQEILRNKELYNLYIQAKEQQAVLLPSERELLETFRALNPEGKEKVIDYLHDISPRYIKNHHSAGMEKMTEARHA